MALGIQSLITYDIARIFRIFFNNKDFLAITVILYLNRILWIRKLLASHLSQEFGITDTNLYISVMTNILFACLCFFDCGLQRR